MSEAENVEAEEAVEVRLTKLEAKVEQVIQPVALEDVPDLRQRLQEQQETIGSLVDELQRLESKLDRRVGVADAESSTHEKRVQDAAEIMVRRAEASDTGRVSMYSREIGDALVDHNHPDLTHTQLTRVMDDLADRDGFSLAKGQRDVARTDDRSDIREVQVVQCEIDSLAGSAPTNNVVGGDPHDGARRRPSESNSDAHGGQ